MIPKSPCSHWILWPMHDRRHVAPYNHRENLAVDPLQIQPAEIMCSIYDCINRGRGLPPAKSRTTCGPNSAIIGVSMAVGWREEEDAAAWQGRRNLRGDRRNPHPDDEPLSAADAGRDR